MDQGERQYIIGLFPAIENIKNEQMRENVIRAWFNAWKRSNFERIEDSHQFEPARDRISYTNVDHTNQVCRASKAMAGMLTESMGIIIQMDHLMAGAVLHDVDKIVIFDALTAGYTETGRRFAHAAMGASMALMEGLPESVAHIIGAHSPLFSKVQPQTVEAQIVRHVDQLIAQAVYVNKGLDMDKVVKQSLGRLE